MEANVRNREFTFVGIKHTGKFADYGTIVPQAAQRFLARVGEIPHHTKAEVSVYEPLRGGDHIEGFFYTGILVTAEPSELPEGMEFVKLTGTYAVARGYEHQMGELYSFLDRWIQEQGYVKDWSAGLIVEVYDKPGSGEVELCLPLKG